MVIIFSLPEAIILAHLDKFKFRFAISIMLC